MESKHAILKTIAGTPLEPVALPDVEHLGIVYPDPFAQFAQVLESVGGSALRVADDKELGDTLKSLSVVQQSRQIFSQFPAAVASNVELDRIDDPRQLNNLDLAVLPGELAVAENAAVWVTDRDVKHRVVYFIAEHLILVVDANRLVHNMHQAYQKLRFDGPQYGVFISGPSKTADIEQSLVIGAQGPRSLHVLLRGPSS